jgi:ribosomal protein S18 acetylase RimI-like enzyme
MSPSSDRLRILELEWRAFRAWPALETRNSSGWVQRLSGGYTKRANSINVLEPPPRFTSEMKEELERPYRERGEPPVWRLTPLAPRDTDLVLSRLGYRRIDESLVQVAPLDARFVADPAVAFESTPSADWLEGFATLSPVAPIHRGTMARMLRTIAAPVGFARVEQAGRPAAFALGVVDGDHVGLFDVLVAPDARRQGLARRLTVSVGAWGRSHGARFAYLQVVATNAAALPLYASLGFETVYSYAYRVP